MSDNVTDQWEYMVTDIHVLEKKIRMEGSKDWININALGAQGWELTAIVTITDFVAVFKRKMNR